MENKGIPIDPGQTWSLLPTLHISGESKYRVQVQSPGFVTTFCLSVSVVWTGAASDALHQRKGKAGPGKSEAAYHGWEGSSGSCGLGGITGQSVAGSCFVVLLLVLV